MTKEQKRSITYTILTILLISVAIHFGGVNGGEDSSLISFVCALGYMFTAYKAGYNMYYTIKQIRG